MRVAAKAVQSVNPTPSTSAPSKVDLRSAVLPPSASNQERLTKLSELRSVGQNIKARLMQATGRSVPGQAATPLQTSGFSREATVTRVNGQVVIDTGDGDDQIRVTQDPQNGNVTVSVNGESRTFTGNDRNNLVIRAGAGNDVIQ
ncbi:MAG: hypothetical protein SNJ49_12730, partial [Chloracidobacterium sp.]